MADALPPIYKFLTADMRSPIGASDPWEIGKTMRVEGPLVPCETGLHGWPLFGLLNFTGERLVRVEIGAEYVWHGDGGDRKIVARAMTPVELIEAYNDRTLRLFAADCAERVLPLFEQQRPNDNRPRQAVETARRFANGEATRDELAAAWAAARGAARGAARDAAWAAARAAARGAARDAEREWQVRRLAEILGLAEGRTDGR